MYNLIVLESASTLTETLSDISDFEEDSYDILCPSPDLADIPDDWSYVHDGHDPDQWAVDPLCTIPSTKRGREWSRRGRGHARRRRGRKTSDEDPGEMTDRQMKKADGLGRERGRGFRNGRQGCKNFQYAVKESVGQSYLSESMTDQIDSSDGEFTTSDWNGMLDDPSAMENEFEHQQSTSPTVSNRTEGRQCPGHGDEPGPNLVCERQAQNAIDCEHNLDGNAEHVGMKGNPLVSDNCHGPGCYHSGRR